MEFNGRFGTSQRVGAGCAERGLALFLVCFFGRFICSIVSINVAVAGVRRDNLQVQISPA